MSSLSRTVLNRLCSTSYRVCTALFIEGWILAWLITLVHGQTGVTEDNSSVFKLSLNWEGVYI